ncbi:hypothetical protein J2S74_005368 [Evansella vedderi]|uniref:Uncharacterized protein n=1 Tax=Evansella vedderi TaxID=38282 RepID=A0ABU0A6E8_9BACI|nr:hypothetical protein [Evansella vedderi]MDQ0257905.1 hypothetical protein [Evansella vedderi]
MLEVVAIWIILLLTYYLSKKELKKQKGVKFQYIFLAGITGALSLCLPFENPLSWYTDFLSNSFGNITKLVIGK